MIDSRESFGGRPRRRRGAGGALRLGALAAVSFISAARRWLANTFPSDAYWKLDGPMSIVMLITGAILGGVLASAVLLGRVRTERALREAAQASGASQRELLEASRSQLRDEMAGISTAVLEKTAESLTRELTA